MPATRKTWKDWLSTFQRFYGKEKAVAPSGGSSDIVILIMGPTGVGKSRFIKEYSGNTTVLVGHGMEPCTQAITPYAARVPQGLESRMSGHRLVLVDTPGFDNESVDDEATLHRISAWVKRTYRTQAVLAGIVYMSDITQERVMPSWRTINEKMSKVLGVDSFSKVVLATTHWDKFRDESHGPQQEKRLTMTQKDVIKQGAKAMHIRRKPSDQHAIVSHLLVNFLNDQRQIVPLNARCEAQESQVCNQQLKPFSVIAEGEVEFDSRSLRWGSHDTRAEESRLPLARAVSYPGSPREYRNAA